MNKKKCPYLEIVTMTYCGAYPIKKLVPLEVTRGSSPCLKENYEGCALYKGSLHDTLMEDIRGFQLEKDLYYHGGHMWLRPEGENIRLGVDDFSRRLLSPITGVNLPLIGTMLKEGENTFTLRCGHRLADLPSPLDGEVVDVHDGLHTNPVPLNKDPYGDGWMLLVHPSGDNPLKETLSGEFARRWLEDDIERLHRILEAELGVVVTDGGEPLAGLSNRLEEVHWNRLIRLFFVKKREE